MVNLLNMDMGLRLLVSSYIFKTSRERLISISRIMRLKGKST